MVPVQGNVAVAMFMPPVVKVSSENGWGGVGAGRKALAV